MYLKCALFAAISVAVATPAMAGFYVVRKPTAKECIVVEEKPADEKTYVIVGKKVYKTRAEAEKEIKVVCVEK